LLRAKHDSKNAVAQSSEEADEQSDSDDESIACSQTDFVSDLKKEREAVAQDVVEQKRSMKAETKQPAPQSQSYWDSLDSTSRLKKVYQQSKESDGKPAATMKSLDHLMDKTIDTLNVSTAVSVDESFDRDFDEIGKESNGGEGDDTSIASTDSLNETHAARISQSGSLSYFLDSSDDSGTNDAGEREPFDENVSVESKLLSEADEDGREQIPWSDSHNSDENEKAIVDCEGVISPVALDKSPLALDKSVRWKDSYVEDSPIKGDDPDENSVYSWGPNKSKDVSAMMSPITTMKKNNIDVALAETELYMNRIRDLMSDLDQAQKESKSQEAQRISAEERIRAFEEQNLRNKAQLALLRETQPDPVENANKSEASRRLRGELQRLESRNDALTERNETLVKECKFADQTCVEVSCKNAALEEEVTRLLQERQDAKVENEGFHNAIIRSAHHSSLLEAEHDAFALQVATEKSKLETQIEGLSQNLFESKQNTEKLNLRVEKLQREKIILKAHLSDASEGETIDSFEVTSIAQSQIDDLYGKLKSSHESVQSHQRNLEKAKTRAKKFRDERDILQRDIQNLEQAVRSGPSSPSTEFNTPTRASYKHFSKSVHTPTSQVLAKTLQSELQKTYDYQERLAKADSLVLAYELECESFKKKLDASIQAQAAMRQNMEDALRDRDAILTHSSSWARSIINLEAQLCKRFGLPEPLVKIQLPLRSTEISNIGRALEEKIDNIQFISGRKHKIIKNGPSQSLVSEMSERERETSYAAWAEEMDPEDLSRCSLINTSILEPESGTEEFYAEEASSLKKTIYELNGELNDKEVQLEEIQEELDILRQEMSLDTNKLKDVKNKLNSEKKKSHELVGEVQNLHSQLNSLTTSFKDHEQALEDSESMVKGLEDDMLKLRDEKERLQKELESTVSQKNELDGVIDDLHRRVEDTEGKLADTVDLHEDYGRELRDKSEALVEQQQQSELLSQEVDMLRSESTSFLARIRSLESSKAAIFARSEELQNNSIKAELQLQNIEADLRKKISEKDAEICLVKQSAKQTTDMFKAEIKLKQETWALEKENLVAALNRIKPDFSELQLEYTTLKQKAKEAKLAASKYKQEARETNERLEQETHKMEQEVSTLQLRSNTLAGELKEAQSQVITLSRELKRTSKTGHATEEVKSRLENDLQDSRKSLDVEVQARNELMVQMAELEDRAWSEV
jgi:hypothetical protein